MTHERNKLRRQDIEQIKRRDIETAQRIVSMFTVPRTRWHDERVMEAVIYALEVERNRVLDGIKLFILTTRR